MISDMLFVYGEIKIYLSLVSLLMLWFLRVRVRLGDLALFYALACWVSVAVSRALGQASSMVPVPKYSVTGQN